MIWGTRKRYHDLVLPVIHDALVNECGHRYGYRNFDSKDDARNTLPFDVLTMAELSQNNHGRFGQAPNFAVCAWELDVLPVIDTAA
ncbi:hypothetical protein [Polyangium sorediatum]|uniref:Uncharacterized protein n=1 Tax=Polyangium sorediatum TaxID=889274 RepID=A0ABT6P9C7_9BACT|nr:hypothetical protein [Polyangium sorediatum]MDI1437224.1 hypothetical protein [Polyangium sorediatum]